MNISDPSATTDAKRIAEFERRHDLKLPADYCSFLLGQNGGRPYPNSFAADSGVEVCVSRFLSLDADAYHDDLDGTREEASRIGKNEHGIIQIGYDVGGQVILMATKGSLAGTHYLIVAGEAHVVAGSFTDLLIKMETRYGLDPESEGALLMDRIFGNRGDSLKGVPPVTAPTGMHDPA